MESINYNLRLSKGPAAAHIYLTPNFYDYECCQLTLDWSYDGVYFKYQNDTWITLSIGKNTKTHDIDRIDTDDKKKVFKIMSSHFFDKLQNYSICSNNSLIELRKITDILI